MDGAHGDRDVRPCLGEERTGRALDNAVLRTEGRVTLVDGILASAVLNGLVLNATAGIWQAEPAAGFVLVFYAARECAQIMKNSRNAKEMR